MTSCRRLNLVHVGKVFGDGVVFVAVGPVKQQLSLALHSPVHDRRLGADRAPQGAIERKKFPRLT
jgi:hypothetical protein